MSAVGTQPDTLTPPRRPLRKQGARRRITKGAAPYLLLLPTVVIIAGVLGYPLYRVIVLSFQNYGIKQIISGETVWIGIKNYTELFGSSQFWTILLRTIVFTAVNVGLTMVIGVLIALLLRRVSRWMRTLVNFAMIFVWAMPVVVAITVFDWLFDQQYGVVNYVLSNFLGMSGFDQHDWYANPIQGFTVISAVVIWGALPFVVITMYAGLTQVPKELEEAAQVDGANAFTVFRNVTYPILRPLLLIVTSLEIIWDFGVFNQVFILLHNTPTPDYFLMSVYLYNESFGVSRYGLGSAVAVIMVLCLVVAAFAYVFQLLRIGEVE